MNHGVPHDLIIEILGKLTVKSLFRFKCVSKQWFRLITHPYFTDQYLSNQRKKDPRFLTAYFKIDKATKHMVIASMVINGISLPDPRIPYRHQRMDDVPHDGYHMLNSCDGILCFLGRFKILVLNPSTREHRILHQSDVDSFSPVTNPFQVAINFPQQQQQLGFGRDLVTKRLKIVKVFNPYPNIGPLLHHHDCCEIFTLRPNPKVFWNYIGKIPYKIDVSSPCVYVNGAIYWFTDDIYHLEKTEVIIMLDLNMEKFQSIPHPSCCSNRQRRTMQLGSLRESLCLAQQVSDCELNIWIMEKEKSPLVTWEKLYCIKLLSNDLQFGVGFAFAEDKNGRFVVCGGDKVYVFSENGDNGYLVHDQQDVPISFTESLERL
ncbi:hypothetical protein J1N35_023158 [Gossypium stocksii]|uniref:F-box domain-containing protein n=1 Tax=Gossypium stocksii TaxID=47602 RepID=A0A9D3VJJ8_9ROSI|nr:hypothetical protein J1N35_023158 [Gossypium stocksii]